MSKFVRPAGWLRHLFTQSQTSPANPTEVSDDVSLIQPYDGGGIPLWDAGQWALEITSSAAAATSTLIYTVPANRICRLYAMSAFLTAGVAPTCTPFIRSPTNKDVSIAPLSPALNLVIYTNLETRAPVIAPGHKLLGHHGGGDVLTIVRWAIYYVEAPIGTVFYI